MKKLNTYLRPYKKELVLGPLFKLLEAVFELLIPALMVLIIDKGIGGTDQAYIVKIGLLMLGLSLIGLLSAFLCQYYASKVSQGFGTELRNGLFKQINTLSYEDLDKLGTNSLTNRLINDVNQVQIAIAMLIRLVIRAPFLCIGGLVMAIYLDFSLSMIILLLLPIFIFFLYLLMHRSVPIYRSIQKKLDKIVRILRENLSGVRVIRGYGRRDYEEERFYQANDDLSKELTRVGRISSLLNPMTSFLTNMAIIAILYFGGLRINLGAMTQGQVIAFISYINLIVLALLVVANLVILFTRAYASAGRIVEILEMKPSLKDEEVLYLEEDKNEEKALEFRQVYFSYEDGLDPVLKNVSFSLNRGESLGIIGVTGSGKTSLLNLIARFYDCQKGQVLVDGRDVKSYRQEDLRKKIGLVPQKSTLFSGTIRDNLSWARPDASLADIERASKISQSHDFVTSLDGAYDFILEEGGSNLSGGQRQRLAIARALVGQGDFLLMDDSLSALDYRTDRNLRRALKEDGKKRTTIIVSQRISGIKEADKILVMDKGEIVAQGNHKELLSKSDVYQKIYRSQREVKRGDDHED